MRVKVYLTPTACHICSDLSQVWSSQFYNMPTGAHFLRLWVYGSYLPLYKYGGGLVWGGFSWVFGGLPGAPIDRGLVWRRPPNAGSECWYYMTTLWTPRCTSVWPVPKWWKSYSLIYCTFYINIAATLLWGGWITFKVYPTPQHPVDHRQSEWRMINFLVTGGRPTGTYFSSPSLTPIETSMVSLLNGI